MKSFSFYTFIRWQHLPPTLTCGLMLSVATFERDWAFARAWLFREVEKNRNLPV